MKKKSIIAILVVFSVFLFRLVQVAFSEMGEGDGAKSPDTRFLAVAESHYTTRFFGGRHNYNELTVQTSDGRRIQHIVMDEPPQGMVGIRDAGLIQWAADSSSVTYSFRGAKIILSVVP